MLHKFFLIFFIFILPLSCSKKEKIYEPTKKVDPYVLYKEGYKSFESNDFFNANKKFSEAEVNFKEIEFAAKAAMMSCFSLYGINFYDESLQNIERYLKTYPANKNVIYLEYLKAIIFFEQMSDEKKEPSRLCVNLNNKLIQKLSTQKDFATIEKFIATIYVNALLQGHHPLSQKEMNVLTDSLIGIMEMGISNLS